MDAAEIDRELGELEGKIEHLRALYEQYFMGFDRLEPLVHRRDVERRVGALRREQLRNTAQRFKFNTIVQRFNTMQQHWARVVREIENGTYRRDVIRAAARFGEGALTALGKKKTRALAAAVAREQAKRAVEETFELGADDLIEDEDDAPTPPRPISVPPPPALPSRGAPLPATLGLGLLPRLSAQPKRPDDSRPDAGPAARLRPAVASPAAAELSVPSHLVARVLPREPAVSARPEGLGALELELDVPFGAPAAKPPAKPAPSPAPLLGRPAPIRPAGPLEDVARPVLPTPKRTELAAPAPVRPSGGAAMAGAESDLPDQRIRQIYAKYVDTRRSTQESTAGITFEKLAASLRAQADKLRSAHPSRSVDYEVVVKDGKTHLKPVLR